MKCVLATVQRRPDRPIATGPGRRSARHAGTRILRTAKSKQPRIDPSVSRSMLPPPPELPLGSPLTTMFTAEPGATLVPAVGLSLITEPEGTVWLDCCVTVPTTSPAPVIAAAAAVCVMLTTFGTVTAGLNVAVTNWSSFATRSHELVPAQAPLHPAKYDPEAAEAASLTFV